MGWVRGRLAPLAVRPFNRLLSSYTLNELGDSVGIVALAVLVYDRTQAVAPTAAFFVAAKFLPALVAPALTARLDQVALRRSLPALYFVEALAFAALALIAHGDFVLGLVLALGLVDGALAITGRSLTRGAVAAVLQPAGLLKEGNALMNIGFAMSSVGGAALAGLLIAQFSVATALLADAASFFAIAILLALTRGLPAADLDREPFWERFNAGIRFARTNALVRMLLVGEAVALVLFTLIIPIEVIYAKESLNTTSAGFGILLASWGAGIVVGSLIYLLVKHRSALTLIMVSTVGDRRRLPRHGDGRHAADRVPRLGRRRRRQRRPVDRRRHRPAGGDAVRLPGADRRPARVARRRDARRRLPARRHAGGARLAPHRLRVRGNGRAPARPRGDPAPAAARPAGPSAPTLRARSRGRSAAPGLARPRPHVRRPARPPLSGNAPAP